MIDIVFYKKNGYLKFKNLFNPDLITKIHFDAKSVFFNQFKKLGISSKSNVDDLNDTQFNDCLFEFFNYDLEKFANCGKQIQHLISLHKLSLNDKILEILYAVGLKFPNISTRPVVFFNHPKLAVKKVYNTVDAHQDWRSMQGSLNSVVLWLPLVDIDKTMGPLEILPGSHVNGLLTDHIESGFGMVNLTNSEKSEMISIDVEVGDALLFSSFLIHQSGDNISNKPRWSCHFRYNDLAEDTFINRGYVHPYIYKPSDDLITPNFPSKLDILNLFKS